MCHCHCFYVTQILELFFVIFWFQEMNLFFGLKVFSSFKKTQRIDFFCELNLLISWVWRKELKLFFQNITQRIFFLENSQRNWTFWWIWLKELNSFWTCDSKNWTLFGSYASKNWTLFEKMTQRIVFFLEVCLKEFNSFLIRLKELNFFWYDSRLKELKLFSEHDSFFFFFLKKLWLKESKLFPWL